jgi:cation:H+ antiporter
LLIDFQALPLFANLIIFTIAGTIIWFAGTRAAQYADAISDRTGLGDAFVGLVFLALATETPEIATTITAATIGNAPLAVNNLFGGVVTQTAMLVVADVLLKGNTLTYFTPKPVLALQGQLLIILLGLASGLMLVGELVVIGHVGLWTPLLLGGYIVALYISRQYEKSEQSWQPVNVPEELQENADMRTQPGQNKLQQVSTGRIVFFYPGANRRCTGRPVRIGSQFSWGNPARAFNLPS